MTSTIARIAHAGRGEQHSPSKPSSIGDFEFSDSAVNTPCIEYPKSRDKDGYGQIRLGGKTKKAHRVAWERAFGPIPDGLQVLHRCDNPPCWNPQHLFLGTHSDNHADKKSKGRGRGQTPALSINDVIIAVTLSSTHSQREIAFLMGVSKSTIGRALI